MKAKLIIEKIMLCNSDGDIIATRDDEFMVVIKGGSITIMDIEYGNYFQVEPSIFFNCFEIQ